MLKEKLRAVVRRCSPIELDELLGMAQASGSVDLESALHHAPTTGLQQLEQAILQGNVIRNNYRDTLGRGCLMYWLWGATNNESLWAKFSDDARLAEASRTVRFFDRQMLSLAQVQRAGSAELAHRRAALVALQQETQATQAGSHLATPAA